MFECALKRFKRFPTADQTRRATATIFQYSDRLPADCCCSRCCCCCCCGASKLRRCAIELLQSMHTFTLPQTNKPPNNPCCRLGPTTAACYHKYEILSLRSNAGAQAAYYPQLRQRSPCPSSYHPSASLQGSLGHAHTPMLPAVLAQLSGLRQQPFYGLFLGH